VETSKIIQGVFGALVWVAVIFFIRNRVKKAKDPRKVELEAIGNNTIALYCPKWSFNLLTVYLAFYPVAFILFCYTQYLDRFLFYSNFFNFCGAYIMFFNTEIVKSGVKE
jgi:hypothetical protein